MASVAPRHTTLLLLLAAPVLLGCGVTPGAEDQASDPARDPGSAADPGPPAAPSQEPPLAPWARPALSPAEVPPAYLTARGEAENREWCALLAFDDPPLPADADARVRTAEFGGGWGVAYDLPELRSAFGVAGTGVEPGPDTYDDWPHQRVWRDGSRAGYGPEGGSGPKQLAYLRINGQRCLYNVWSHLGRDHLEALLESLRFVGPLIETEH